jgi:signal transduction histidine kinase
MSIVDQRTILIVSDDAEFPRQVAGRWQGERMVPSFTVLGSDFPHGYDSAAFDLAVVGPLRRHALRAALKALEVSGKPILVVAEESQTAQTLRRESSRVLTVSRNEGSPETVVLVAIEILRRVDAVNRAERAEHVSALLKCHATLGQYVIEMRHTLNNALTSVLGNSELLLLEPGAFSAGVRSQIDTIRNMAMRMHEILQRFSSLEKELTFAETQAVKEQTRKAQATAVGQ